VPIIYLNDIQFNIIQYPFTLSGSDTRNVRLYGIRFIFRNLPFINQLSVGYRN